MTEKDALMALNAVPGLGNARIRRLLETYHSAREVWDRSEADLIQAGRLPLEVATNIRCFKRDQFLENEYRLLTQNQVAVLSLEDEDYPRNLWEIPDAPVLLYIKGSVVLEDECGLAVVGSRKASVYGISVAEKFSSRLAELGITIISGLARGIDAAAHQGCLRARGRTLAVLGSGLAQIYPPEHKELFSRVAQNGAVISEFPMATQPYAFHFPRRNRIISGLALGVLVVEASARSGALITSDFALEQGREVFAVPGRVDTPQATGTHQLIKNGAKLVSSVEDILEELAARLKTFAPGVQRESALSAATEPGLTQSMLTPLERKVIAFVGRAAVSLEEIVDRSGESGADVLSALLTLELKHYTKQLPGKYFVRGG